MGIEWYVPHYTPSIRQQAVLSKHILSKVPTELQYVEIFVITKELNTENLWSSELGTQQVLNVPVSIIIRFQRKERQDSQNLNNDTFYRSPVTSAQYIIGTENHPDSGILLNYDD